MDREVVGEDHPYASFEMTMSTDAGACPSSTSPTTAISSFPVCILAHPYSNHIPSRHGQGPGHAAQRSQGPVREVIRS